MRLFRWWLALLLFWPLAAGAFDLPGLFRDSAAYRSGLERRFPAGGTPQARAAAESRIAAAERRNDPAALATVLEERVALGEATPAQWLALARAQLRRSPPEAERALLAAWQNFHAVPTGEAEIPSLLVIAEALGRLDRHIQRIATLEAVVQRAPGMPQYAEALREARRAAGLLVTRLNTEPEAEPARACLGFTVPPARRADWNPADWVRAEPPLPGLAVTREGDQICAVGLPHGQATRLVLRAGLPGEDDLRLLRDTPVTIRMPDRLPRLAFDSRAFLLPRGQAARVPLGVMNVSAARLQVLRVTERSLVPLGRDWQLGQELQSWTAENVAENWGREIWSGAVEIPRGPANQLQRLALPLPQGMDAPGLYILLARSADGTRPVTAAQAVIVTDLGLTAWRGAGGLAVQARRLSSARAEPGVRIALLARSNEVLAEARTDAEGVARFAAPLLRGEGGTAPVALHAETAEELVPLDLSAAAFDLSDRGAEGRPHPGPLDAFLYTDRGIYRPGETVHAVALLREASGAPAALPLRLRLRRPNGQVAAEQVVQDGAAWDIPIPNAAPAGQWRLEALTDPALPPVGEVSFRVDAFVPERLAVEVGPAPGPLVPGQVLAVPLSARFLYGAPGSGLPGSAELRLQTRRDLARHPGFAFGLEEEEFAPDLVTPELGETDAEGRATVGIALPRAPDTTRPLSATLSVLLEEPGGRASQAAPLEIPVAAPARLVGIAGPRAVDADAEAGFSLLLTDAAGTPVAGELAVRLVRERPDWRIVLRGGTPRYETVWTDEAVDSATLRVSTAEPARFSRRLPFGRYRLEARDRGGLAIASFRFRAGWVASESAEVPDKVDVSADRPAYAPGATARLRLEAPFAGIASVAVLTDRLVSVREVEVTAGGAEVEIPVDAAWGAGAHVAVTVFRPGTAANGAPARALGLAWLQLDPAARRLEVAVEAPERARPRTRIEVPVRVSGAEGPVRLTLAAVDEGILRLTRFRSPDPLAHFTARRALGTDIRDDYGRLIAPPEGEAAALRQGGDEFGPPGALQVPQRTVALFSGVVEAGPDGVVRIPLDLPDFAGELRLMAVAWAGPKLGADSRAMTVRDPILAEAVLPRFLAPGDEATVPVLLHNLEGPEGEVVAEVTTEGPLALAGDTRLSARLAVGARALPGVTLRATGAGEGVLRLAVSGPGGFQAEREARITLRSSRAAVTEVAALEVAPGETRRIAPAVARFVPGSWRAGALLGTPVRFDAAGMLRFLSTYPLACLEQSASRALALAAATQEGAPQPALQGAVEAVLSRQRYDGSFGLWSAQGEPEYWTGAYATEALLRARAAGAAVPEAALNGALDALSTLLEETSADSPEEFAAQAARLHALSLAGRPRLGAARRLMEALDRLPTPIARAQLGAAFARAGDRERAERAFAAALAAPARRDWLYDYGSAARDALAVLVLVREAGMDLPAARDRLPGPELTPELASTQEAAWAVLAAAALGRDARPIRATLDGAPAGRRVELAGPAELRNAGEAPLPVLVSTGGIPADPLPAGRAGFTVRRRFLALDGTTTLNLDTLRRGQDFLLVLEARAETGQRHLALLQQGLPAGWEIVARLGPGPVPSLGDLPEPDAVPALDDRAAAAFTFTPDRREFRMAVRMRATTAGRFELPGAEVFDMYRPAIFARGAVGRITVGAPSP
ncbi:alpha-2-macroglobulin family protein [Sabulicella glaciei]|uniref:Alpha-2-macroglobulin family protein n=1 Tax=Sabulicella glaciei TaxID=2984948 RepID=A0ABT3NXV9_9PROT|nr:alpha-2-macroglobulin [Roseococcus sp. MDT2-1-1]MCW8087007.1 alpha-2-macroglobulin family protein [Roseococcus sp. MDT2-1-1]